jgi:hypothetical protein
MWKIAVVLILTALAMLGARLAYQAPMVQTRIGAIASDMQGGISAPLAAPLMYAGVRG